MLVSLYFNLTLPMTSKDQKGGQFFNWRPADYIKLLQVFVLFQVPTIIRTTTEKEQRVRIFEQTVCTVIHEIFRPDQKVIHQLSPLTGHHPQSNQLGLISNLSYLRWLPRVYDRTRAGEESSSNLRALEGKRQCFSIFYYVKHEHKKQN